MISGMKCSGKIKKTQARNLLLATGSDEIIITVSIRRFTDKFGHVHQQNLLDERRQNEEECEGMVYEKKQSWKLTGYFYEACEY
jgi:hypothetical protein